MAYTKKQIQEAQQKLQSLQAPKPYVSAYQGKIDSLLNDINNRKPFSYDFNADPVYQQYRERYQDQGKLAMQDTAAASAALTGGYGNSYGATAGNLAYQGYLKGLNDLIPGLKDSAYNIYANETSDMYNRLGAMQAEEDRAIARYNQQRQDYMDELAYWSKIASSGSGGGGSSKKSADYDAIRERALYNAPVGALFNGDTEKLADYLSLAVDAGNITLKEADKIGEEVLKKIKKNPYG